MECPRPSRGAGKLGSQSIIGSTEHCTFIVPSKESIQNSSPHPTRIDSGTRGLGRRNRGGHKPDKGDLNGNRGVERNKNNDIQGKIHKKTHTYLSSNTLKKFHGHKDPKQLGSGELCSGIEPNHGEHSQDQSGEIEPCRNNPPQKDQ